GGYSKVDGFTAGVTYTTAFWLKTEATSDDFAVKAWMPDASFATVSMPVIATVSGNTDWTRYEYTWTAKSTSGGTAPLRFSVTAGQGSLYVDEVDTYQSVYTVTNGSAIGTVPNLPKQNGKSAVWLIDGEEINASTVYHYTENKTAVAAYANTLTFDAESVEVTEKVGEFAKVYNAATAELTTADTYNGGKAISLVRTDGTAAQNASFSMTFNGVSITAGETYTIRFKLKTAGAIHFWHIGDGSLYTWASTRLIDDWVNGTGEWMDCSYTYTSAFTQENLILGFQLTDNGSSTSMLIDELYVESPNETLTVSKGNPIGTLPALSAGMAWTIDGEVITADTIWNYTEDKTAVAKTAYTLTFQQSAVKEDWTESEKLATGYLYQAGAKSIGYQSSVVASGNEAIQIKTTSEAYAVIDVMSAGLIEYKAGETYTIRFKAYGNSFHLFIDHGAPALLDDWINPGSGWLDYELTFTVPNGVTRISFLFKSTTGASEQNIYIDDLFVEIAKEDVKKTVAAGAKIGTLPTLPNGYFWTIDGERITAETTYNYGMDKTAISMDGVYYTLTFEGVGDREIEENTAIGTLPAVPEKAGYKNGRWTVDGVEITAETTYTYGMNKTAVAVYDKVYTLSFNYATTDMIESMKSADFGAVYNATYEITSTGAYSGKALHYTVGTANTGNAASPWICLSSSASAGEYILKFKMKNSRYVNLQYQIGSYDYNSTTMLQANVSTKDAWTEYEYTINLASAVNSLYLLPQAHAGAGDIYIDDLYFGKKFENSGDRALAIGETIGSLPVAEKDGYKAVWTIDGKEITAATVWNYTEAKTAVLSYVQTRFTLSFQYPIGMEDGEKLNNGYNLGAKGALEFVTEESLYGSALKYTIQETGVSGAYIAKVFTVEAGKTYAFSYYMNITESNSLEMSVYAEGSAITAGDNFTDAVSGVTNGWVYRERVFTPNTSGNVIVYFRAGHGSGGNGTVYIDEIYLREHLGDAMTVYADETIGALPAVPEMEGYTDGRWTVDGEIINADTVWSYTEDKAATFIYAKLYTLTFGDTGVTKQLSEGEKLGELPAIPEKDGYVGAWWIDGRKLTENTVWNYNEDLTATIEYQIDLGVEVTLKMEEGASVRVSGDNSGIRFETRLNKADYDALVAKYGAENIETGTYILPYALIGKNGIYAYVTDASKIAGNHYVQVINEGWYNEATATTDGYYRWYGSLVKIKPQNYALNYVGIGYVKVTIGEESILVLAGEATLDNSRSIYQVAYKAYIDEDNGLSDAGINVLKAYLNEVAVLVSNGDKSAPVLDTTLSSYGYTPTYTLSKSAETGNYIVTAAEGKTINALIVDSIAYKVEPANVIYFSYYKGTATVLSGDETSTMNATIVTASELENGVQATYTSAAWDAYKVENQNMSLTHGLKSGNVQVSNLTNSAGESYLTNTLDAYVVSGGNRVYGKTGSNTYGGTTAGSARLNTFNLGYYYYEASVRDITFNSNIPLYLSKTYHTYSDKMHQEFTVVASGTTSNVTALGFEMKIPMSSVTKYVVDGTENASATNVTEYVGFDINGVGVVGIIVAGDNVTVTLTNDGMNYIVRQEKAMSILSKAADGVALTDANTFSLWNRLYTDETHDFNGIKAANNEEQNPLTASNITVESKDGGAFIGYDHAKGAYSFAINGEGFNNSYANPYKQYTESITIKNALEDRTVYIRVKADKAVEGAAIMDEKGTQLPISVQVGKNFQTEYEEPIFDPTDAQWGITVAPIRVEKSTDSKFTVINAMQNWGEFGLKQLSSISYYIGYYHLSTGVTETNCIAPYFSYSNSLGSFNNAWILPDFRGGDTMWNDEPQYDSVGMLMGVTNGASTGMDDMYYGTDLGVYVDSNILSSGMTHADVEYSYVSANGDYEYTYRHVEMPQTDEARTYYTLTLKFLKDTSIDNTAFSLFSLSSRNVKYASYEYLDTNGNVVNGSNPTSASTGALFWKKTVQTIYPLHKGGSYFALYGVNDKTQQNGNFGLIVKDYAITVNGANSDLGLAFKNDFIDQTQCNLAGLTLASSTDFKAGDMITLNVILLPYDKNVNNANNVRKVYQDSVVNPLTLTVATGSVVSDAWIPTVKANGNMAEFTLSGGVDTTDALSDGEDSVNYTIKVTGCTKLGVPVIEEYVNGVWQT
ncbi:MAG: hypothetical protein IKD15_03485, partial [Clostridia bacterium]|nr:hypothetical protein [Clostridia bacterium]